ncbi:hypothetical protein CVD28_03510 [Bacillus sp. M6-12]|uniref:hypothetical protein n=1 Tax=Bacillus sp. M6-12 TaxID=2054166 RepID=UPI000C75D19A|nr:hypothetical protein [Bacillus sp. M6-12]PLS19496.1 hypothetical protein CVD28_03510 [Bacillus sp. M6-12]
MKKKNKVLLIVLAVVSSVFLGLTAFGSIKEGNAFEFFGKLIQGDGYRYDLGVTYADFKKEYNRSLIDLEQKYGLNNVKKTMDEETGLTAYEDTHITVLVDKKDKVIGVGVYDEIKNEKELHRVIETILDELKPNDKEMVVKMFYDSLESKDTEKIMEQDKYGYRFTHNEEYTGFAIGSK